VVTGAASQCRFLRFKSPANGPIGQAGRAAVVPPGKQGAHVPSFGIRKVIA